MGTIPHLGHALHREGAAGSGDGAVLGQGQVVHYPEYLEMTPAPSPCPIRRPHGAQKAMQPPAVSPALPAACHSTAVPASMALHHSPHKAPRTDTTGAVPWARTQADVCVKMYRRTIKYALDICKRLLITRSAQVPAPRGIFFPKPGVRSLFLCPAELEPLTRAAAGLVG